jgi:hypothetical protein
MSRPDWTEIVEPGAWSATSPEAAALISIAISLKRLADQLAGDNQRSGLVDAIYDAARPT